MRWLLCRVRSTEWLPLLCMYVRCFLGALSAALMQVAPEDVHGANGPPDAPPLTLFLGVARRCSRRSRHRCGRCA